MHQSASTHLPKSFVAAAVLLACCANAATAQSSLFTITGTFPAGSGSWSPSSSAAMVTGDFNRDGNLDIVTANTTDGTITLLLGDGAGSFTQAPASPIRPPHKAVSAIATGDFNNDGNPDLVLTSVLGTDVLLGDGAGGFVTGAGMVPSGARFGGQLLAVADFNGDGKLDLVLAGLSAAFPMLLPGDGTGAFGPFQNLPLTNNTYLTAILAGDFNGDGKMDLAAVDSQGGGHLVVYAGDGTGQFRPILYVGPDRPYTMLSAAAAGDFNRGGKMDILSFRFFATVESQTWFWTGNTSSSSSAFSSVQSSVAAAPVFLIAADFNGDGKLDWAGVNPAAGTVAVNLGDGTGRFTPAAGSPYNVGGAPFAVAAGDFNGDGKTDLAVDIGSNIVVLLNSTAVVSTPTISEVDNGFSNLANSSISPGAWVVIKGAGLSNTSPGRGWNAGESFPTSMDGTSVTIGGKPAFLYYISPAQINVQAPDMGLGTVSVVVNNKGISSPQATAMSYDHAPALLQWGGGQYPYALISRGSEFVGNPAVIPNTLSAHGGDALTLWATGLGLTTPPVPAGQQPAVFPPVATPVTVTVGGVNATVLAAVLRYAGLYQVNIQLPPSLPAGDLPVKLNQLSFQSPDGILINVQ